ncbi:hypothetical protein O4H26_13120 [Aequorivita viscosa]|nr:hypothetical protein [Aequorivita viscosa]
MTTIAMASYSLPPQNIPSVQELGYELKIWKPSFTDWKPNGFPRKYYIYSFFHFLKIFRNRNYCAVFVMDGNIIASSMLLIPSYFKWPFMKKNDLQFCFSITKMKYRGQGINTSCKADLMRIISKKNQNIGFWGILSNQNISSKRVLAKLGLKEIAQAYRTKKLFSLITVLEIEEC